MFATRNRLRKRFEEQELAKTNKTYLHLGSTADCRLDIGISGSTHDDLNVHTSSLSRGLEEK